MRTMRKQIEDVPAGFHAYQIYLALKLHFTSDNYDFHKYHGKVRVTKESFYKRRERILFGRIENKYKTETTNFFVANILSTSKFPWLGDMTSEIYDNWKKNLSSNYIQFQEQLGHCLSEIETKEDWIEFCYGTTDYQRPGIVRLLLANEISTNFFLMMNHFTQTESISKSLKNDIVWEKASFKLKKYLPFVKDRLNETEEQCRKYLNDSLAFLMEKKS